MTTTTNYTFEHILKRARMIREALPYLANLPDDTAELCEALILRLELAEARGVNRQMERAAEPEPMGVLERERAYARKAAKFAVEEAKATKAKAPKGQRRGEDLAVDLGEGHHAVVTPGLSIRLHGVERNRRKGPVTYDRTYEIGDTVAMHSYNLVYTGQIVSIGPKTVTIRGDLGTKRLNLEQFSWYNRLFDLEDTARRNAEESFCI